MHMKKLFDKFPVIDCGEFLLREITEEDEADVFEIYSDYENIVYDRKIPFEELSEASEYIKRVKANYENGSSIRWAVSIKYNNKLIGIAAANLIDVPNQRCNLGYILNKKYWRKGIMSSCIEKLLGFIFEEAEFHRVSAYINPTNAASIRLINKMGFVKEGVLRDYSYNIDENKFEDRALYSLIRHITI